LNLHWRRNDEAKNRNFNCIGSCECGSYEDLSGKAILEVLGEYLSCEWESVYEVIPDEQTLIEEALKDMADEQGCCLIVTTGGTGPALRE